MKKIKTAVLLVISLALLFSGCKKGGNNLSSGDVITDKTHPAETAKNYMTLLYSMSDTFNPYTAKTHINRQLCRLLYEPLFKTDNNFAVTYSIAQKAVIEKTACTVAVKDVLFSDGTPLTADDVVYSFNLAKSGATSYGFKLYNALSAKASDSKTVVFTMAKADPYFLNLLDFPIIKKGSDKRTDSDGVILPPVGCGRYKLNENQTELVLNEKYPESGTFAVKTVKLLNAPDSESLSHYVEIGAADMYYSDISDGKILRMSGNKVNINLNNLVYIGINNSLGDLSENSLRQAISSGIDRTSICRDGYYNNAIAATGFYNPLWQPVKSVQNTETVSNQEITVENLEKIGYNNLDSAGVRQKSNGAKLKFNLLVNKDNLIRVAVAKLIAKQLSAYGFKIQVVEKPYDNYMADLTAGNFDLYLAEIQITPNMDLSNLIAEGGSAAFGTKRAEPEAPEPSVSVPAVTSETAEGETPVPEEKSATAAEIISGFYSGANTVTDVAAVLQTEMPFVPVCYRTGVLFYNDNIENVNNSSVSDVYFSIRSYTFKGK